MNLPNKITMFRVCMIPVFLVCYLSQPFGVPYSDWAALLIFILASASDALDGHIARSRGLITNFGKLMDPLADKLLVAAALIAMTERQVLPAWAVVIILSREFFITGFRQLVLEQDHNRVMAASLWGKLKTVVQMVMIVYLLWDPAAQLGLTGAWQTGADAIGWILMMAAVLLSVLSAAAYVRDNRVSWQ